MLVSITLLFLYSIFYKKIKKFDFKYFIILEVFVVLLIPHLIWLHENDYVTISYGLKRTGLEQSGNFDNIKLPIIFFLKQLGILIPFFILNLFLIKKFRFKINFSDKKFIFLFFVNLLPIILIILTSAVTGSKIRTMWMTPFYLFFGVMFIYFLKSQINIKKISSFIIVFVILFFSSPIIYSYISVKEKNKRTDYAGKEIAELVERRWNKNFSNEIMYVIGDEWHAGNLSYHLPSRPKWFESIKGTVNQLDPNGGIVYTGNAEILKQVCPGDFGKIKKQGFCMIGSKN